MNRANSKHDLVKTNNHKVEFLRIPPKFITEMVETSPKFSPQNIFPSKYFGSKFFALNVVREKRSYHKDKTKRALLSP